MVKIKKKSQLGKIQSDMRWGMKPVKKDRYLKHSPILHFVTNPKVPSCQRKCIINSLTKSQIGGFSEFAREHIFHKKHKTLSPKSLKKLKEHKKFLVDLSNPNVKIACKKLLLKQKGGFLPLLFGPALASLAGPIISGLAGPLIKGVGSIFKKK